MSFSACSLNLEMEPDNYLGTLAVHADSVYDYSSIDTTADHADLILKGTILNITESQFRNDRILPYSTATISIDGISKGNFEKDTLVFSFLGGDVSALKLKNKFNLSNEKPSPNHAIISSLGNDVFFALNDEQLDSKRIKIIANDAPELHENNKYTVMLKIEENGEYTLIGSEYAVLEHSDETISNILDSGV